MSCFVCGDYGEVYNSNMCKWCYKNSGNVEKQNARANFLCFGAFNRFTDVSLVTKSTSIAAHKVVLASRSSVFRDMLENEIPDDIIEVTDVSYGVLRAFVNYLYTGEASLDENLACDLLVLAEEYKVKQLKTDCEKFLIDNLYGENALESYSFAHKHNAKNMRDAVLHFIWYNRGEVTKTEEYKKLLEKDPRLLVEIYDECMSNHGI